MCYSGQRALPGKASKRVLAKPRITGLVSVERCRNRHFHSDGAPHSAVSDLSLNEHFSFFSFFFSFFLLFSSSSLNKPFVLNQ